MKKVKNRFNQKGFSLTEIMVVVVIIGILTSIAIPNYQRYQRKARQIEPKLILGGIYTSSIAFNSEWGYSTSNFIQLGFSPSGDVQYKTGFNALVTKDPGNWVQGNTLPTNLSDYDGPPVPSNPSNANTMINTEDFCNASNDCTYLSTGTFTVPTEAKIDNTDKFAPKFIIIAVGNLGGAQEDHWEMGIGQVAPKPTGKYMINIKNGL